MKLVPILDTFSGLQNDKIFYIVIGLKFIPKHNEKHANCIFYVRHFDPFYILRYFIKWVKASWKYSTTNLTRWVSVLYSEKVHGPDHGLHGHEDVLVDELDVGLLVLVGVAGTVDNSHLLDKRRLARLSSA